MPIMTAVISFLCRLNKIHERFQIAGIILLCMFVVVLLRHLWLRFDLSTLSEYVAENAVSVYSLDHMKMELYLLYGIGFGSAIAFLIGKRNIKKGQLRLTLVLCNSSFRTMTNLNVFIQLCSELIEAIKQLKPPLHKLSSR